MFLLINTSCRWSVKLYILTYIADTIFFMSDFLNYNFIYFQAFSHVPPLRDYFLREENYMKIKRPPGDIMFTLVTRFGELIRKLWNPRNFKAHVSPHEMLQAVVRCSRKSFQITKQGKE